MEIVDKLGSSEKKSAEEKTSTGKKLIQARLPFKVLSTTGAKETSSVSSTLNNSTSNSKRNANLAQSPVENTTKRRKLNFENDSNKLVSLKENVSVSKPEIDDIILIENSEEESIIKDSESLSSNNVSIIENIDISTESLNAINDDELQINYNKNNSGKSKKRGIKIKLPFMKQKRATTKNDEENSENEISITNPLKKVKQSDCSLMLSDDEEPLADSDEDNSSNSTTLLEKSKSNDVNQKNKQNEKDKVENLKIVKNIDNDNKLNSKDKCSKNLNEKKGNSEDESCKELDNSNEIKKSIKNEQEELERSSLSAKHEIINLECTDITFSSSESESRKNSKILEKDISFENFKDKLNTDNKDSHKTSNLNSKSKTVLIRIKKLREKKGKSGATTTLKRKKHEDKEKLKQNKKEEKEEQKRREKEEKEEQKRKEKEEREEQKRKEKEEKEKKRLADLETKNEEKRQKEEERRKKEEERKRKEQKKEEERKRKEQEKEEAENKKKKAAEAFTKFFVQHKPAQQKECDEDQVSNYSNYPLIPKFMPFEIKGNMKLAPLFRRKLNKETKNYLDKILLENQNMCSSELYLSILKSNNYIPGKDSKTYSKNDDSPDVLLIEDELEGAGQEIDDEAKPQNYKAKFLYFHENQRPPYYGTWRKKSNVIKGRRPFGVDTLIFDYEIDSDDEWEEEEIGESLHGSDDEKDKESEDEYEVDNEFFVPHGHLSEEEMQNEDEEEDNSPETQKIKLKLLQQEFAQEMKKKTEKIKPKLVGIEWQDENGNKPYLCPDIIWRSLNKRAMIFTNPIIVNELEKPQNKEIETSASSPQSQNKQKKLKLSEDLKKDLIRLFHGNSHKREFLIKEFNAYLEKIHETNSNGEPFVKYPKYVLRKEIDEFVEWSIYQKNDKDKKKLCWIVKPQYLKKYNLEDLNISMNEWSYNLEPKKRLINKVKENEDKNISEVPTVNENKVNDEKKEKKKASFTAITKFTKVLSTEEKEKQMKDIITNTIKKSNLSIEKNQKLNTDKEELKNTDLNVGQKSLQVPNKKRVALLISVPRGETIPENRKEKLINDFLKKQVENKNKSNNESETNRNFNKNENVENNATSKIVDKYSSKEIKTIE